MKDTSISILAIALFMVSYAGFGQIVIGKSDMPVKGDTVRISTGLNVSLIDVSETGADFTWDYSELIPIKQRIDTFRSVWDTPAGLLFALTSDYASRMIGNLPFPGLEISNTFQYYKSLSDAYEITGFAISMQGFPIPANFSSYDILYKFPLEYGNNDSSTSGVDMIVPTIGYIKIDRKRKNTVDGWGTLTTPYGTFDVIRMKSEVSEYDSIYLESQNMGIGIPYSYTEYKWLGKNQKVPLLTVRNFTAGILVEYPDSIRGTLGVNNQDKTLSQFNLFPNPVRNKTTITFDLQQPAGISVSVLDINGKTIYNSTLSGLTRGQHQITLNFNDFKINSGSYFIVIKAGNNTFSKKIIYLP